MRIRYVTTIESPFQQVYEGFNRNLLEYLVPAVATIIRYEGQNPGDIVDIKFKIPFMRNWTIIIKESWLSHREYGFIDRGLRLPAGLVYWQHTHRVIARDDVSCFIIDDVEFESAWQLWDYILYLPLKLLFFNRKFMYRRYYNQLKNRINAKRDYPQSVSDSFL
jgi:ligand-binding SRPBCC domain-containing protein